MLVLDPLDSKRTRAESVLGVVVTVALIWLGFVWPSAFTIVAILACPAPFLFLMVVAEPAWLGTRPRTRHYLQACVVAAIVSWMAMVGWLLATSQQSSEAPEAIARPTGRWQRLPRQG